MKLVNTKEVVHDILKRFPETRNDDYLLWLKVLENVAERHNIPDFTKTMTVGVFLQMAKCSKFPQFETVSRIRRKFQEQYPDLRGSVEVQEARAELEQDYREFARGRI